MHLDQTALKEAVLSGFVLFANASLFGYGKKSLKPPLGKIPKGNNPKITEA